MSACRGHVDPSLGPVPVLQKYSGFLNAPTGLDGIDSGRRAAQAVLQRSKTKANRRQGEGKPAAKGGWRPEFFSSCLFSAATLAPKGLFVCGIHTISAVSFVGFWGSAASEESASRGRTVLLEQDDAVDGKQSEPRLRIFSLARQGWPVWCGSSQDQRSSSCCSGKSLDLCLFCARKKTRPGMWPRSRAN